MRIFAILSLLGVIAAAAFMSTVGARPASAQPVTTITVTKICTGVPDPDAEFLMVLQENGVTTNDVEDATLEVGCGQNVVFMFDEAPGDDYDVVEEVLQGNVVSTLSGCQDIDPVENENVSCTIENVLGNNNTIVVVKDAGGANGQSRRIGRERYCEGRRRDVSPATVRLRRRVVHRRILQHDPQRESQRPADRAPHESQRGADRSQHAC